MPELYSNVPKESETYNSNVVSVLYDHYFPHIGPWDSPWLEYLDAREEGKLRALLRQFNDTAADTDVAMIDLAIHSPKGNREEENGELLRHSVALIIDKKKKQIIY